MSQNNILQKGITIIKAVILLFFTLGITELSCFIFTQFIFQKPLYFDWLLNNWNMVFFVSSFAALAFVFEKHNRFAKKRFSEKHKNGKLASCIKDTFTQVDFYIEIIVISALSALLPVDFLFGFVKGIFFSSGVYSDNALKINTLAVMLPLMVGMFIIAKVSVRKIWYNSERKKSENTPDKDTKIKEASFEENNTKDRYSAEASQLSIAGEIHSLLKNLAIVILLFCGLAFVFPMFIPPAIAVWNAGGIKIIISVLAVIITPFIVATLFYFVRGKLKRNAFVSDVKEYCQKNKATFTEVSFDVKGYNFKIEKNGKIYCCKIIETLFPNSPTTFVSGEYVETKNYFRFIFTKLFYITTTKSITFDGEGKKILIVVPDINKMYSTDGKSNVNHADNGEKNGEYTIYFSKGFFSALERDSL